MFARLDKRTAELADVLDDRLRAEGFEQTHPPADEVGRGEFYWFRRWGWKQDRVRLWVKPSVNPSAHIQLTVSVPCNADWLRQSPDSPDPDVARTELDSLAGEAPEGLPVLRANGAAQVNAHLATALKWFDSMATPSGCLEAHAADQNQVHTSPASEYVRAYLRALPYELSHPACSLAVPGSAYVFANDGHAF